MSKIIKCCLAFFLVFICTVSFSFAGDQDRTRDRQRDGSCQESIDGTALLLAGNQDTDESQEPKDPNQDLSRKEKGPGPIQDTEPELDQDKDQDKKQS